MKRILAGAIGVGFVLLAALGVACMSSAVVQTFHDSCRRWHEPPPWADLCPPSTRHGAK